VVKVAGGGRRQGGPSHDMWDLRIVNRWLVPGERGQFVGGEQVYHQIRTTKTVIYQRHLVCGFTPLGRKIWPEWDYASWTWNQVSRFQN
jgi:hypothetical protein